MSRKDISLGPCRAIANQSTPYWLDGPSRAALRVDMLVFILVLAYVYGAHMLSCYPYNNLVKEASVV